MTMRLPLMIGASALLLTAAAPAPVQQGLSGEWRNTKNSVHLKVVPCGKALCGVVTWANEDQRAGALKGSGKEIVGSTLLSDLTLQKDGTWKGKVFLPKLNTSGSATITQVDPKLIRVSGCTLLGLVCKTQHWHKIG